MWNPMFRILEPSKPRCLVSVQKRLALPTPNLLFCQNGLESRKMSRAGWKMLQMLEAPQTEKISQGCSRAISGSLQASLFCWASWLLLDFSSLTPRLQAWIWNHKPQKPGKLISTFLRLLRRHFGRLDSSQTALRTRQSCCEVVCGTGLNFVPCRSWRFGWPKCLHKTNQTWRARQMLVTCHERQLLERTTTCKRSLCGSSHAQYIMQQNKTHYCKNLNRTFLMQLCDSSPKQDHSPPNQAGRTNSSPVTVIRNLQKKLTWTLNCFVCWKANLFLTIMDFCVASPQTSKVAKNKHVWFRNCCTLKPKSAQSRLANPSTN